MWGDTRDPGVRFSSFSPALYLCVHDHRNPCSHSHARYNSSSDRFIGISLSALKRPAGVGRSLPTAHLERDGIHTTAIPHCKQSLQTARSLDKHHFDTAGTFSAVQCRLVFPHVLHVAESPNQPLSVVPLPRGLGYMDIDKGVLSIYRCGSSNSAR